MDAARLPQFEALFKELFKPLCSFAMKYLPNADDAKGIVHEGFVSLWEKFDSLPADTNYRSYLYTTVRNRCLNFIRDRRKLVDLAHIRDEQLAEDVQPMAALELEQQIEIGIQSLPEKCREVFELNRREGMKYAQIADTLGISIKTVEAQMSKALAALRVHLKAFLTLIIFVFLP